MELYAKVTFLHFRKLNISNLRIVSTTATLCVSPPFSCVWRLLPSSWFSSASSVLRSLNSVLYLGFFLFPGFLSLVLGLLEQLPFAFSSA